MCGIAGFIDGAYGRETAAALIDCMCQEIRHRGPDDQGTWVDDGVALGMRRLSIIDLAGGHQPIANEDGSVLVVFNGEIYNYRELRHDLRQRGHHFSTECDTEVIVHAYEEYGVDCATHLRGMFSFAIWDRKRRRLVVARDRFGKKPLNYYWDGRRLIFGSEIKSILEAAIPREINPIALDEYLCYGYVPSPNTLFAGVFKLPPGHVLTYEAGRVHTTRYWDLSFEPTCQDDEQTALERTRALLKDAVQVRLMSDVPLGAFLSGGIDSSVVVGLMSELMDQPVKTFSIGFDDEKVSELPFARRVARHFGTDHHEFIVKPELVSVLPKLVWAYDEPFADSSMLPTYYVSKLAREFVTVALTGDGGDEVFGGYERYQQELALDRLPAAVRYVGRHLGKHIGPRFPDGVRGKRRISRFGEALPVRFLGASGVFPLASRPALYDPEYFPQVHDHDPGERQADLFHLTEHLDTAARMQHADTHLYLTDDILVKVDKASMINSLETRTPLLDQHLVAYVTALPSETRTPSGTLKYLLKRIAADMVPADLLTRPKHGFALPVHHWLRNDLADYARGLLTSTRARQRGIFQSGYVEGLLREHAQGGFPWTGQRIWTLLCLELWFQVYLDPSPLAPAHISPAQVRRR
jgi:asparagine synthase (glutamine-hydrolysing)